MEGGVGPLVPGVAAGKHHAALRTCGVPEVALGRITCECAYRKQKAEWREQHT